MVFVHCERLFSLYQALSGKVACRRRGLLTSMIQPARWRAPSERGETLSALFAAGGRDLRPSSASGHAARRPASRHPARCGPARRYPGAEPARGPGRGGLPASATARWWTGLHPRGERRCRRPACSAINRPGWVARRDRGATRPSCGTAPRSIAAGREVAARHHRRGSTASTRLRDVAAGTSAWEADRPARSGQRPGEVVALDAAAARALWGALLTLDLTNEVQPRSSLPVDDVVTRLLVRPARGRAAHPGRPVGPADRHRHGPGGAACTPPTSTSPFAVTRHPASRRRRRVYRLRAEGDSRPASAGLVDGVRGARAVARRCASWAPPTSRRAVARDVGRGGAGHRASPARAAAACWRGRAPRSAGRSRRGASWVFNDRRAHAVVTGDAWRAEASPGADVARAGGGGGGGAARGGGARGGAPPRPPAPRAHPGHRPRRRRAGPPRGTRAARNRPAHPARPGTPRTDRRVLDRLATLPPGHPAGSRTAPGASARGVPGASSASGTRQQAFPGVAQHGDRRATLRGRRGPCGLRLRRRR